jgi:hypothetical protein
VLGKALWDDHARPELLDLLVRLLVANRRRHARSGRARELNRRRADAPRATVHEQPLARAQLALREDRVVRCREDLRQAAGRRPVEPLRHGHQLALVHEAQLSLRAAADDRHHAVADLEAFGARAERRDLPCQLHPRDVLRRARRRRVEAAPLHHVRAVQPCRVHPYEHFPCARLRVRVLLDHDLLLANRRSAHARSLLSHERNEGQADRSNTATHSMW